MDSKFKEFKRKCLEYTDSKTMREYLNDLEDFEFSILQLVSIVFNSNRGLKEKIKFYKELENNFELTEEEKYHISRLISVYQETWEHINLTHKNRVYVLKVDGEFEAVFEKYEYAKKYYEDNLKIKEDDTSSIEAYSFIMDSTSYDLEERNTITNEVLAIYSFDKCFNWNFYYFKEGNGCLGDEKVDYNKYPENMYIYFLTPFKIGDIVKHVYSGKEYVVVNAELLAGSLAESYDNYDNSIAVIPIQYKHLITEQYTNERSRRYEEISNKNGSIRLEELDAISVYYEYFKPFNLELVKHN